jgi:hypothetical protein
VLDGLLRTSRSLGLAASLLAVTSCLNRGAASAPQGAPALALPEAVKRASSCLVVASVTLPQKADLLFGERHLSVLLDLGASAAEPWATAGVVVRGPQGIERIVRVDHVAANGPFHDHGWSDWAALGPGGSVARLVARGAPAGPLSWRKEDGPTQHHTHFDASLTSVVGPFVSVQRQAYEFRENGHFEKPFHAGFSVKDLADGGALVWPTALLDELLREVNADVAVMSREQQARGEPPLSAVESVEGQAGINLAFGVPGTGPIDGPPPTLSVLSSPCCKKDGIEQVKRGTELTRLPAQLGALLTFDPEEPGLLRAPNGCASVGVREGHLVRRTAKGPVEPAFRPGVVRLVALTWLGDGEADAVRALPKRSLSAEDHASLAYRLRATEAWTDAQAQMREAVALEPENPLFLRDLARMVHRYSPKEAEEKASLAEAQTLLERALSLAKTPELRASILYHLGDTARHRGLRAQATQMFERSLAETATDPARFALP